MNHGSLIATALLLVLVGCAGTGTQGNNLAGTPSPSPTPAPTPTPIPPPLPPPTPPPPTPPPPPPAPPPGPNDVLTWHGDNTRRGVYANETVLAPTNVGVDTFGKIFSIALDGHVPAQPLYVSGLSINGVTHNLLYVATEHDSVYAFDADDGTQLWKRSMVPNGETVSNDVGCPQITPEIGVTATPVIDRSAGANGTMYVEAMTQDSSGAYHQRLHAIDLLDGHELDNSPVDITATYPGKGDNSTNGQVVFDPKRYKERTALTLANGKVYMFWASHCDTRPYTGFMMAYDASTLRQTAVWNTDPNGNDGSVWEAGGGPAVDSNGDLVFLVGNGSFDTNLDADGFPTNGNIGNSFVKLSDAGDHMQVLDYFAPFNTLAENTVDEDLGSGGAILLPDQTDASGNTKHLAVGAGKDKSIYVVDRDNMGKFNSTDNSAIWQEVDGALNGGSFGTPAFFNGTLYYGTVGDSLKAFKMNNAKLSATPASQTGHVFPYPGTTPSISANGTENGIVWAFENVVDVAVLHAYDASDLSKELWNSNMAANGRDHFGGGHKFITPIIANGHVYVCSRDHIAAFGLLNK